MTTKSAVDVLFEVSMSSSRALDIREHLPRLKALAQGKKHVTEFGVRHGFGSTAAFLAARPGRVTSYDIQPCLNRDLFEAAAETPWVFQLGSSLDVEIEETDVLFIDTLHTYTQLTKELDLHHGSVRKHIALHDTDFFGYQGEDGSHPGLYDAAIEFLLKHPGEWKMLEHHRNCNGLMILERIKSIGLLR